MFPNSTQSLWFCHWTVRNVHLDFKPKARQHVSLKWAPCDVRENFDASLGWQLLPAVTSIFVFVVLPQARVLSSLKGGALAVCCKQRLIALITSVALVFFFSGAW